MIIDTLATLSVWVASPTMYTIDGEEKSDDDKLAFTLMGSIPPAATTMYLVTSAATTSLAGCSTDIEQAKVENKSLNTYVSSMSDEELEKALMQFNLLESENNSINKTNIKK